MGSMERACISGFLCRLCSEMHRIVIHIYGDQGRKLCLVEKINGYLPITISPTDPLPKTICETCLRRVEQHYDLLMRLTRIKQGDFLRINQTFTDWKCEVRKKLAHNRRESSATGGGAFSKHALTEAEETLARITGMYTVVQGIPGTTSFGLDETIALEVETLDLTEEEMMPSTSTGRKRPQIGTLISSTPKRKKEMSLQTQKALCNIGEVSSTDVSEDEICEINSPQTEPSVSDTLIISDALRIPSSISSQVSFSDVTQGTTEYNR